ncbi:hypothetical protein [Microtetraspora niveoalba]|uniref:hypothetical protein n=1 Tax=Microtetraspora niveoalba TaxID=46175 RepID=UPI000AFCFB42|nr:hypothetical protein [Microtetraspora niveoalba]
MRRTGRVMLLGSALLTTLVLSPAGVSHASATPSEATLSTSQNPAFDREDYKKGFRDGYKDGHADCKAEKEMKKGMHGVAGADDYERGYSDGYEKGFHSCKKMHKEHMHKMHKERMHQERMHKMQ